MSTPKTPKYLHHKPTNQARVWIDGKYHYLGEYDSPESRDHYDKLILGWLAQQDSHSTTVGELGLLYMDFVKVHYRKNGRETSEVGCIKSALKHVNKLYHSELASKFGPKALKQVRESMIKAGTARSSINIHMGRIRRMFKWGVADELVSPNVLAALQAVAGLQAGRSKAVETEDVKPVPIAFVDRIEPFVTRPIWGMIQFQLWTGARPGEATMIRGCDLNMSGAVWEYIPQSHKTEHHGKKRIIFIGPNGQEVIKQFLKPDLRACLFSPTEGRAEYVQANYRDGADASGTGQRRPSKQYAVRSYQCAITRACKKADVPHWSPNRLRHNAATNLRREFGIEAARTVLGHASAVTSEIYAELDFDKARDIIGKIG